MFSWAELLNKVLGRTLVCAMAVSTMLLSSNAVAQAVDASSQPAQAACTFDDGKQMYVRYHPDSEKDLPSGRVWAPGGQPILLFTDTTLELGNAEIPVGAYSMYVIPEKREWTLIVNRDVKPGSGYQKTQDLVREPMEVGELEQAQQQTSIYFGHSAAKQCNMRIYHGSVGTWVEFKEK
jgi:Protein of unknown function (DUF2911)